MPQYDFPGLLPGQKWCLCANRWLEAYNSGMAPPIIAESTNIKTLEIIDIDFTKIVAEIKSMGKG